MLEYKIILPLTDNDGASLENLHNEIAAKLARVFGGFTSIDAQGGWKTPRGAILVEAVRVYTFACASGHFQRSQNITIGAWLKSYARALCYEARQEAIYIAKGSFAEIVSPE